MSLKIKFATLLSFLLVLAVSIFAATGPQASTRERNEIVDNYKQCTEAFFNQVYHLARYVTDKSAAPADFSISQNGAPQVAYKIGKSKKKSTARLFPNRNPNAPFSFSSVKDPETERFNPASLISMTDLRTGAETTKTFTDALSRYVRVFEKIMDHFAKTAAPVDPMVADWVRFSILDTRI